MVLSFYAVYTAAFRVVDVAIEWHPLRTMRNDRRTALQFSPKLKMGGQRDVSSIAAIFS